MSAPPKQLPIERLKALLDYDAANGVLIWRRRSPSDFNSSGQAPEHKAKLWNGSFAGKRAGTVDPSSGYIKVVVDGKYYKAHRIAWAIYYGEQPPLEVDHEDRDRSNNRISNLRGSCASHNAKNQKLRRTNSTGHVGVSLVHGKYVSYIGYNGKQKTLGRFSSIEEAIEARRKAAEGLGYHQSHGL